MNLRGSRAGRICEVDGCASPVYARDWCGKHYERWRKHGDPTKTLNREWGTGTLQYGYLRVSVNGVRDQMHHIVMEEHLGRPLLPHETVHHKNLQRSDNRISNLELWSTSQPPGARVTDLVEWAKEILVQYAA